MACSWPLSILRSEAMYPLVLTLDRLMSFTMSLRVFVQGIASTGVKG